MPIQKIVYSRFSCVSRVGFKGRKMKKTNLVLGLMLIMLLAFSTSLMAATYTVTEISDDGTGDVNTLSWAITQSNASTGVDDNIAFNLTSGSTVTISGPLPIITDGVTIDGNDDGTHVTVQVAIPGTSTFRVFNINASGKTVNLSNMIIKGGHTASDGACVYINDGAVNLEDATITLGKGEDGSGILIGVDSDGVNLTNCTISNNEGVDSDSDGGGICILGGAGTTTLTNCTVSNNISLSDGGGISVEGSAGIVTITNSTINNNTSGDRAGGIGGSTSTTINITNSTIYGNQSNDIAGGVGSLGILSLMNVSITDNNSDYLGLGSNKVGGGVYFQGSSLTCKNTIIANNVRGATGSTTTDDVYIAAGSITEDHNIVENSTGYTWVGTGDITGDQANLWGTGISDTPPLADNNTLNGTQTLKTTTGSVAINTGTDSGAPTTDQRGADRNGTTDIGAYEYWDDDASLPVTLSTFTAQYLNDAPTLCWTTQSETNNAGWNIYRGETSEALSNEEAYQLNLSLGLIPGAGSTSEPTDYSFEDVFPIYLGTTYFYWLESVDYSGESEIYGPISLTIPENEWENPNSPEIPKPYGLHQNYPNPFNPNTEISFMMKESCIGELIIYNIKGQKIKTIFSNLSITGDELLIYNWDGNDESGKEVSSGVYYYKLRTTKADFVRKMILMK